MSGITTTPHLHIQIDNEDAPFYPYWPFSLEDAGEASMSFFDGVSNGLNKDILDLYSVDPIHFIEKAGAVDSSIKDELSSNTLQNNNPPVKQEAENYLPETVKNNNPVGTFGDISSGDKYYTAITHFAKK
jgi:hypothetical protein